MPKSGPNIYFQPFRTSASEAGMTSFGLHGGMLVKFSTPSRLGGVSEVSEAMSRPWHGRGCLQPVAARMGSEIGIQGEAVIGGAVACGSHAGIADDERDADAFLMRIPFVSRPCSA